MAHIDYHDPGSADNIYRISSTGDAEWARALESDFRASLPGLDPADRALLGYAERLTRDPAGVTAAVTAYFAFVNRLAEGLGVDLESYWGEERPHPREIITLARRSGPCRCPCNARAPSGTLQETGLP